MILDIFKTFWDSTSGYANWLWGQITFQNSGLWGNYFWFLVIVSLFFWFLEWVRPWRENQSIFRRDFALDGFYMFFNYFLFSLIGFAGLSMLAVNGFNHFLGWFGIHNLVAIQLGKFPVWGQLLVLFVVKDFVQWWGHRILHRVPWLWEFHKVHHSVKEMGFAAHLRFHWMETVFYRLLTYVPLAMLGFSTTDFFIVDAFSTFIGHWNHANFRIPIGPLKYILNNPNMHMWHHSKSLPKEHRYGVNFGLTLSIWDYIFGTAYIPYSGRAIELGFPHDEDFPQHFTSQELYPWTWKKRKH